jgi:hypothetical protein
MVGLSVIYYLQMRFDSQDACAWSLYVCVICVDLRMRVSCQSFLYLYLMRGQREKGGGGDKVRVEIQPTT